ncbi:ABC transporter ATP-binding protein [Paenibacillus koleovorans]|uniref:ABC transporter ATP-binding protein n=1 Tax=Paenibacillus koleovorans TaxID=121608 RepID=UPI000FD8AD7B|nr:ABC transporter ATP-binding protein [Paenibacillus koleovorans]
MAKPIVHVEGLDGGYFIGKPILHNLTFSVLPGEMVGLIGLNGAGKSTTIKHLLGLLQPQRGSVRIGDRQPLRGEQEFRSQLAYVPESPELYQELTIREHLRLTGMVYKLEETECNRRIDALGSRFQMTEKLDSFPQHLSKGMKQKVMIMCAFLVQPPLYIIDEPFLGLDPLSMRSLLELMVAQKRDGAGLLVSSHILSTIEKYCDRYIVLHKGRTLALGTLEQLREQAGTTRSAGLEDVFFALIGEGVR